ncbi:MAG: hypothetical protein ACK501_10655 [Planctomycetota bacterium]|jgi:hypothetical protein
MAMLVLRAPAVALAILLPLAAARAQVPPPTPGATTAADGRSGVVRLLQFDDLRQTFGFTTGDYGRVLQEGEIRNFNSQVAFVARDGIDHLWFGSQGGEHATAVDVGDPRTDTAASSCYAWTLADARSELAKAPANPDKSASLPVQIGHVYLVSIEDPAHSLRLLAPGEKLVVMVRVVDHVAGRSLELRWQVLNERLPPVVPPHALPALPKPPELDAATELQVAEHVAALVAGEPGVWPKAQDALQALGHLALPGIVGAMAQCDLKTAAGCAAAWRLGQVLSRMALGVSVPILSLDEDAACVVILDHNAAAVRAWHLFAQRFGSKDALQRMQSERKARGHR